ncbi:flagellar biosynthetic protein FliO [Kordiimonas aquimaris]|uniref:flagellar biosynthetic protein FliO n=1 Tax=Kordiimonas aquimaris TaxID=707591 RepID=UPI0021CDF9F4|nr:flagellar biosynthetic protein FliO [Kordiimonas aquimaris]
MTAEIFNAFAALVFVLGLLGLFAWGVRRFGFIPGQPALNRKTKELEIIETKMVDARNKLLVARWRGTDYLLASGPDGIKRIDEQKAQKQPIADTVSRTIDNER